MIKLAKNIRWLLLTTLLIIVVMNVEAKETLGDGHKTTIFAGGCFWCMQPVYDNLDGVISTSVGYTGGKIKNPTYEQVITGTTGHAEAIEITYDPAIIDYKTLLDAFWVNIDPLDFSGQFCDQGDQYRTAIFYHTEEEKHLAEEKKQQIAEKFDQPVATEITAASIFYHAENYHQNYYQESFLRYKLYRTACGRDKRLEELWQGD